MEVLRTFDVDGPACDATGTAVILAVCDLAAAVVVLATNEGVDLWCFAVEYTKWSKPGRCDQSGLMRKNGRLTSAGTSTADRCAEL